MFASENFLKDLKSKTDKTKKVSSKEIVKRANGDEITICIAPDIGVGGHIWFEEKFFFCFSHCCSKGRQQKCWLTGLKIKISSGVREYWRLDQALVFWVFVLL